MFAIIELIIPVSYTHLDVYKRQHIQQLVVGMKEELEKIKEQLLNVL